VSGWGLLAFATRVARRAWLAALARAVTAVPAGAAWAVRAHAAWAVRAHAAWAVRAHAAWAVRARVAWAVRAHAAWAVRGRVARVARGRVVRGRVARVVRGRVARVVPAVRTPCIYARRTWPLLICAWAATAHAHIASNGFLALNVVGSNLTGTIELAMRDGELAVGLDSDRDGKIKWGEVRSHQHDLELYVRSKLSISDGTSRCSPEFAPVEVNERVDGNYLWLPFTAACGSKLTRLAIDYRLLQDIDPSHRGLLTVKAWGATQTGVLGGSPVPKVMALDHLSAWRAFAEYLRTGVWHIWSGIDHLLFLLSLLLPAVLKRRNKQWEAVSLAKPAFVNILKVVTAFTIAHSITLSLAAFDVVRLPSRLTESVIAASIIVAALNNIFPKVTEGRWRIAFAFGLLHGFGFASVLADMGLPPGARVVSLVAFNLGVELGQLAVVLAVMPLAYTVRASAFYRRTVMQWASSAIAGLALVWLVQRAVG
jgi:HupE / UreJ protein